MSREPAPLFLVYDGAALDRLLYRIVRRCPPVLEDFLSYEALGLPYDRRAYFKGIGISVYPRADRAAEVAARFHLGAGTATLDLRGLHIVWARTGRKGHLHGLGASRGAPRGRGSMRES